MKILLLGHKEIYSNLALSLVANGLSGHELEIFLSGEAPATDAPPGTIDHLEYYESRLCDTVSESAGSSTGEKPAILTFDELAGQTGRPIGRLPLPNSVEGLALLREKAPDLIVSLRYRKILKDEAIAIPRYGVLNLHSGLLPEYRGAMATFWAMLNGDSEIGATLHYVVDGSIDTGPIIGRSKIPLSVDRSYMASVLDLYPPACRMVLEAIQAIETNGTAPASRQQGNGQYFSWPSQEQVDDYFGRGYRFYDRDDVRLFIQRQQT